MELSGWVVAVLTSPAFFPALTAVVSALGVAWLNSRGTLRKQQSEEAAAIRAEAHTMREELRGELASVRTRLEAEIHRADGYRETTLAQRETIAKLTLEVDALTQRIRDLGRLAGDRRHPENRPGAAEVIADVLDVEAAFKVEPRPIERTDE